MAGMNRRKEPYTRCGKCADIVWQRARYGQIHYEYHKPANPRTPAQTLVRDSFRAVSVRWRTLAEQQRLSWCAAAKSQRSRRRLGRSFPLRGFDYFMRINVALANRGQEPMDWPPADDPPAALSLPLLTCPLHLQALQLAPNSAPVLPAPGGHAPPSCG